jgi:large-conductance mechanosensitive channel
MLTFLFGVSIPFLQTFTVDIQGVTSDLIDKAEVSALGISDTNSRQAVLDSLQAQESGLAEQQLIYGAFIQYSSIIIIVIIAFILFMASRRDVEQNVS